MLTNLTVTLGCHDIFSPLWKRSFKGSAIWIDKLQSEGSTMTNLAVQNGPLVNHMDFVSDSLVQKLDKDADVHMACVCGINRFKIIIQQRHAIFICSRHVLGKPHGTGRFKNLVP